MKKKIYIITPGVSAYFIFINNLYNFGYIKEMSKDLQVILMNVGQVLGLDNCEVFVLWGSELNDNYTGLMQAIYARRHRVKWYHCPAKVTKEKFYEIISAKT